MINWVKDKFRARASAKADICLHALGFIQVRLDGDQELRIWHPNLPRAQGYSKSQIHSTSYCFGALVLKGSFRQDIYLLDKEAHNTNLRIWVRHISCDIVGAGMTYQMAAGTLHSITLQGLGHAAAVMTRLTEGEGLTILGAPGIDINAEDFDRFQMSNDDMWAIIRDVMGC